MMKLAAGIALAIGCVVGADSLAGELPSPFDTELGRTYRAELTLVQVPANLLPPGCVLARTTGSAPIYPATTNPHATEDRRLIGFVAALIGGRRFDPAPVLAAITALYHDGERGREIGVWPVACLKKNPMVVAPCASAWRARRLAVFTSATTMSCRTCQSLSSLRRRRGNRPGVNASRSSAR